MRDFRGLANTYVSVSSLIEALLSNIVLCASVHISSWRLCHFTALRLSATHQNASIPTKTSSFPPTPEQDCVLSLVPDSHLLYLLLPPAVVATLGRGTNTGLEAFRTLLLLSSYRQQLPPNSSSLQRLQTYTPTNASFHAVYAK
jgi:hypothetical protein